MLLAGSVPAANAVLVPARCRWVGRVVPASDRQQVTLRLARPYSGVSPSSLTVRLFPDLRVRVSVQTLHHVLDGFRLINLFPYFLPLIRCNLAAGGVGGRYYPFLPLSSFQCSDTRAPRPRKVWKTVTELACGYGKNTHPQGALPWETVSMDTESRCCFADRSKKEGAATDGARQRRPHCVLTSSSQTPIPNWFGNLKIATIPNQHLGLCCSYAGPPQLSRN